MEDARIALVRQVFAGWKARDFDALLKLAHPELLAELALPPGEATRTYRGADEIAAFLRDGDADYEHFDAEPQAFAIGPTGRVFAEGTVSYRRPGSRGISSVAYWVSEIRDDKIVFWRSFSDRRHALAASGLNPGDGLPA